jgi:ABC-2 type transport system permease protein
LREALRQPAVEITNIFFPLFFMVVTVGSIGKIASSAFGVDDYVGFQLPLATITAASSVSAGASLGLINDIQGGYFDKLLLTPANRASIVLGRMFSDAVRAMALSVIILFVGIVLGAGMATGVAGFVTIVLLSGLFALAYSGLTAALALRTGSSQAAQLGVLLFFPLIFLSPAFAPKEVFQGWLEFLATINPLTYILEAQRDLVLDGWDLPTQLYGLLAILGIGVISWGLTFWALSWRAAGRSGPIAEQPAPRAF